MYRITQLFYRILEERRRDTEAELPDVSVRGFPDRGAIQGMETPAMSQLLEPLFRFFTEEDGWLHVAAILIALVFCIAAHCYEKWKDH